MDHSNYRRDKVTNLNSSVIWMSGIQIPTLKPSLDEVFSCSLPPSLRPSSPKLDPGLILLTVNTKILKWCILRGRIGIFMNFLDKSINKGVGPVFLRLCLLSKIYLIQLSKWLNSCITVTIWIPNTWISNSSEYRTFQWLVFKWLNQLKSGPDFKWYCIRMAKPQHNNGNHAT